MQDGREILALTIDELVHVRVAQHAAPDVLRVRLQKIDRVTTTGAGLLRVSAGGGGRGDGVSGLQGVELDPARFEYEKLRSFFEALYLAVVAAGGDPAMGSLASHAGPANGRAKGGEPPSTPGLAGDRKDEGLAWRLHLLVSSLKPYPQNPHSVTGSPSSSSG